MLEILETCSTGDRWPGSGLMKQNICATASNSWRSWHQIPQPEKKCADYSFPPGNFSWARGERDLAISLGIPGSEQSSWSSPVQHAPFSLEVWTNGHCLWDWRSKGQAWSRDWHPRAPRMWYNTNQVPGWFVLDVLCRGCMWVFFQGSPGRNAVADCDNQLQCCWAAPAKIMLEGITVA